MRVECPAVRVEDVSFSYGARSRALRSVSLELGTGVHGLLGPNGAGKSTLMFLMATVLPAAAGKVEVAGHDVSTRHGRRAARRLLGLLPQRFDLVGGMTLRDTVAYAGWSSGLDKRECVPAALRALELVQLDDRAGDRVRRLSGGQRQRLGIAAAVVHDPQVLILDEPTVGLDPVQRVRIRQHLETIGRYRTVLISTHMIEDVVKLCGRIVVLNEGGVVYDGPTEALAAEGQSEASALVSPLEAAYQGLLDPARTSL